LLVTSPRIQYLVHLDPETDSQVREGEGREGKDGRKNYTIPKQNSTISSCLSTSNLSIHANDGYLPRCYEM